MTAPREEPSAPMTQDAQRIVLASSSPRRSRLLAALNLEFEVVRPKVDEPPFAGLSPRARAMKTAELKARDVAGRLDSSGGACLVLAADTIVVLGDRCLGKPRDREHARAMLGELSGREHSVTTGLAIQRVGGTLWLDAETTRVTFARLSRRAIERYVDSGQAEDKAGAYGVQEIGGEFIESVAGDLTNVIGLPLIKLRQGFNEVAGLDILSARSPRAAAIRAFPRLADLPAALLAAIRD